MSTPIQSDPEGDPLAQHDYQTQAVRPQQPPSDANRQSYDVAPQHTYAALKTVLLGDPAFTLQVADDVSGSATFTANDSGSAFKASVFSDPSGASIVEVAAGATALPRELLDSTSARVFADLSVQLGVQGQAQAGQAAASTMPGAPAVAPAASPAAGAPARNAAPQKRLSALVVTAIVVSALFLLISLVFIRSSWNIGILIMLALLPVIFTSIAWYVTRKGGKVGGRLGTYIATGLTVAAIIIGGVRVYQSGHRAKATYNPTPVNCQSFQWPDSEVAKRLPDPDAKTGELGSDSSTGFHLDVCKVSHDQFESYINAVKEKGFSVDYQKQGNFYYAKDADGYSVRLDYNTKQGGIMSIDADAPTEASETASPAESDAPAPTQSESSTQSTAPETTDSHNGTSSDFRTSVDEYEAFMNKYVEFMNTYNKSGDPASMLADYTDMMQQYSDMTSKWSNLDESGLSQDDISYYLAATQRITAKLATVQP